MAETTDTKDSHDASAIPATPVSEGGGAGAGLERLMALVTRLRAPDGCPWDREQTLDSVRAYVLEEAHETAAAIDAGEGLAEELGDLLFQVVFIARLAEEAGRFDLGQAIRGVEAKMIERHPHVFGPTTDDEGATLDDAAAVRGAWERRKAAKKPANRSLLAGVPTSLPALTAAYRLTQKAAGVGFDWPDVDGVTAKIREELEEVETALAEPEEATRKAAVREEVGDLLFAVANLARHLDLDPEAALAGTNLKFRRRFAAIEQALQAQGVALADADLTVLDAEWERAKAVERAKAAERGIGSNKDGTPG